MKKNDNKLKNILYGILIAIGILLIIFILMLNSKQNKKDDKTLSYTDLIKQVAGRNVDKVEMTVGSTSLKVTLKNKIDENGQIIEQNEEEKNEGKEQTENKEEIDNSNSNIYLQLLNYVFGKEEEKVDEELVKKAIVPNVQNFIELIQTEALNGNEIELIQHKPSLLSVIPSYIISFLPTFIMLALFIALFKMQGLGDKGEIYDTVCKYKKKLGSLESYKKDMLNPFWRKCPGETCSVCGQADFKFSEDM